MQKNNCTALLRTEQFIRFQQIVYQVTIVALILVYKEDLVRGRITYKNTDVKHANFLRIQSRQHSGPT